jgi:hypothetical protein
VGATHWVPETTTVNQQRACPQLPGREFGWAVERVNADSWRVSNAGSVWDVSKLGGNAVNQGNSIRIANFSFVISAHQKC